MSVDGKFFRLGDQRFYVKGLAYGPFAPNAAGLPLASPDQTARDFGLLRDLGANLIRVYHVPPEWFLELAVEYGLKVMVDIPWNQHQCFLQSAEDQRQAREAVRRAVLACRRHPAVFAFGVANEIPPDIVRWSGAGAVADFLDELVLEAKTVDPECLCTYSNFPPTEFLQPRDLDFICFNVYLHQQGPFRNYLARLQMVAEAKPLLLGEFGMDSLREGEERKSAFLEWQVEEGFRAGLAGVVAFTFTDDWWRGGQAVLDWQMGVTTRDRSPKASAGALQRAFTAAPHFPLPRRPRVSVVVASYNGARTLAACLQSLRGLNYPDYEVILVDDGSTDDTPAIARQHPEIKCLRHERNLGLSAARNTGIAAATGEIVAFTDADCRADQDWLYYLVGGLLDSEFAGIGGPNLLPPEDSLVAAAVMVSPGGPVQVMLTDRQAEHIPGCNMAFYRWALEEMGGFDPVFRKAGDDVDLCWRLQQAGYKLGFSPSAFVWHYRRSTVRQYLRQQRGYGEAEALLVRKHPENFNSLGGSVWLGRIYAQARCAGFLRPPIIYRGRFGSAGFQFLYPAEPAVNLMLCATLEYHVFLTLPLWVLAVVFPYLLPLAIVSPLISLGVCLAAGAQAVIPKNKQRWWSRPLVGLLFLLQPIVRGWARYQHRLTHRPPPAAAQPTLDSIALRDRPGPLLEAHYWAERRIDRLAFAAEILLKLEREGWPCKADIGWSEYDVEVYDTRWSKLQLTTVAEEYPGGKQMIRCRLRPRWTLRSKAMFWSLCALELVVLGLARTTYLWLWLVVAAVPLLAWYLHREGRNLQSVILVLLDNLAQRWGLTVVRPAVPGPQAAAGAAAPPVP